MQAKRIVLVRRPTGMAEATDFSVEQVELPPLADGEVAIDTLYLSVDPYMRGRFGGEGGPHSALPLGSAVAGSVLGRVTASRAPDWAAGDFVLAGYGWQTAAVVPGSAVRAVRTEGLPLTAALSVLGSTGVTGYWGMVDIGRPAPGETVVVSAAAGAVGLVASQVARIAGARVVGVAGTDAKCAHLASEARLHAAVNYRAADFADQLAALCPDGVDVYFDNVGGPVSQAVLRLMAPRARIVICGQIAEYNGERAPGEMSIPTLLLSRGASMQGFMVMRYADRAAEARAQLARWVADGQLAYHETVVEGFEATVPAFQSLFTGANLGKLLVHAAD